LPRSLFRALAISIVFHVFLLWPEIPAWREATPAASLTATLRSPNAPAMPATPSIAPKPVKPAKAEDATKRTPPSPLAIPGPVADVTASTPNPTSTTTAAVRSADSPAVAEGVDAEGLRSYRLALAREAKGHKRFPTRAIEAGWTGTTELRVSVSADGMAPIVRLEKSSGHDALDNAALDMLRNALPTTPVPPSLRGRTFVVNLPVVFELPE
jgi:protein TonB